MKSEPSTYSIEAFKRDKRTLWTGVRNYQARNYMMGAAEIPGLKRTEAALKAPTMSPGDTFLFYHSNAEPTACVGLGRIENVGVPDPEQFDKKSEMFEPKSTKAKPMWFCAEVAFKEVFARPVTLEEIRTDSALQGMVLIQKGSRLSIQPVTKAQFDRIVSLSERKGQGNSASQT